MGKEFAMANKIEQFPWEESGRAMSQLDYLPWVVFPMAKTCITTGR